LLLISIPSGAIKSACLARRVERSYEISIPSGAIKSRSGIPCVQSHLISIPSGAIKRNLCDFFKERKKIFQFLLVRLRERQRRLELMSKGYFNSFWCD